MKRIFSMVLALAMVLSLGVFPAIAETATTSSVPAPTESTLPTYMTTSGFTTSMITDTNEKCLLMTVKGTTSSEFDTYLTTTLKGAGYAEKSSPRPILGTASKHAIYANDSYLVNATYDASASTAQISIEPLNGLDLSVFSESNKDSGAYETLLIQMGLDDTADANTTSNGMCYIYRMSNGEFVIYDGGYAGNANDHAARIYKILKTYAPDADNIVIAAWLITHPHIDHIGAFMDFTQYYLRSDVTLEKVICYIPNLKNQTKTETATYTTENGVTKTAPYQLTEKNVASYNDRLNLLDAMGVDIYRAHAGQLYYIGNLTIEILFSFDLLHEGKYCPVINQTAYTDAKGTTDTGDDVTYKTNDDTNTFSIVSQVKVDGQNAAIFTGDATNFAIYKLNDMYGTAMDSTFVQTPHHGGISNFDRVTITQADYNAADPTKKPYGLVDSTPTDFTAEVALDLFYGDNDSSRTGKNTYYNALYQSAKNNGTKYGYVCAEYVLAPASYVSGAGTRLIRATIDGTTYAPNSAAWNPTYHLGIEATVFLAMSDLTVLDVSNGTVKAYQTTGYTTTNYVIDGAAFFSDMTGYALDKTSNGATLIYTAVGLTLMSSTKGVSYALANDITVSVGSGGALLPTMSAVNFKGTFDGKNKTIKIAWGDDSSSAKVTASEGWLFASAYGAIIQNVTIDGVKADIDTGMNGQFGVISGQTQDVTMTNVHVKNASISIGATANTQNVAGLCGNVKSASETAEGTTTIKNCTFHGSITQETAGTGTSVNVGGLVGRVQNYNDGATTLKIEGCKVLAGSEITGKLGTYGGVIGYVTNAKQTTITDTVNNATVSATNYAGGIIGTVTGALNSYTVSLDRCQNNGYITALYAGGMVARTEDATTVTLKVEIKNCVNTGDIETTDQSTTSQGAAGGAVGSVKSNATVTITTFHNSGDILVKGGASANDARIASTVGRAGVNGSTTPTVSITGVTNVGNVDADAKFKGIYVGHSAGSPNNITIQNCINFAQVASSIDADGQGTATTVQNNQDLSDKTFEMLDGGRIRLSDTVDQSGIRFDIALDQDIITVLQDAGYTVKLGSMVVSANKITGDFTKEALEAAGKSFSDVLETVGETHLRTLTNSSDPTAYGYTAAVIKIPADKYENLYSCVGYIEISNSDGFAARIYTAYDASNAVNVKTVASDALKNNSDGKYNDYLNVLNAFNGTN